MKRSRTRASLGRCDERHSRRLDVTDFPEPARRFLDFLARRIAEDMAHDLRGDQETLNPGTESG